MKGTSRFKISKIQRIIDRLDIKVQDSPESFSKGSGRFYYTPCVYRGKKTFLKVRLQKNEIVRKSFEREYFVAKFLPEIVAKKLFDIKVPRPLDGDITYKPEWMLFEWIKGKPLGLVYEFNKEIEDWFKFIPILARNLVQLVSLRKKDFEKIGADTTWLVKVDFGGYKSELDYCLPYLKGKLISKRQTRMIEDLFVQNREFLEGRGDFLAHGDFSTSNFLCFGNQVVITDWEHIHLDNQARDMAHLWIQSWEEPRWRDEFLYQFINNMGDDSVVKAFRLSGLFEGLRDIWWWYRERYRQKTHLFRFHTRKSLEAHLADIDYLLEDSFEGSLRAELAKSLGKV
jgi:aminoglycoside phosphotransferase (APT) family kinase protein